MHWDADRWSSATKGLSQVDVDRSAPASLDRPPIDKPLATGVKAIDSLLTLGQGQRIGIFAEQALAKARCLACSRGDSRGCHRDCDGGRRGREVRDFIERTLGEEGVPSQCAGGRYKRSTASLRIQASGLRPQLQNPSAIPAKTYYCWLTPSPDLPWLSANYPLLRVSRRRRADTRPASSPPCLDSSNERRTETGSITAVYSVLVEGDDTNEPIADTMRGLLDGHIVLSRALGSESYWPAIDVLQSLSRLQPHLVSTRYALLPINFAVCCLSISATLT